jgi:hypothetical protein
MGHIMQGVEVVYRIGKGQSIGKVIDRIAGLVRIRTKTGRVIIRPEVNVKIKVPDERPAT